MTELGPPVEDRSITVRLGAYIAALASRPLADDVFDKAATCLLDGLCLGIAAGKEPTARRLLSSPFFGAGVDGCRVWPTGRRASLADAVMLNGYAVHARFQDDTDMTSWSHPGSIILPAAISVGEATDASLERVLRGIVSGYSVLNWLGGSGVVGRAVVERSFRGSPTLGPVGAAAAAATVLGLDAEQSGHATAIAAASAGGVIDTLLSGSSDWRFQNASAAWRGAMAAILAAEGIDGAPEIFESPKGFLAAFAGTEAPAEWQVDPRPESILTVWAKPYPTLGDNVAVVSAAIQLSADGLDPASIERIAVHQNAHFASYPGTSFRGPYEKPTQAIASTAFGVCAALARGAIEFDLYSSALEDPLILSLIEKLSVTPEPEYDYLDGKVVVTTTPGDTFVCETRDLPQQLFYRDADFARAAFEATLREVLPLADLRSFPTELLDRVGRGDTDLPVAEVISQAMTLRDQDAAKRGQ